MRGEEGGLQESEIFKKLRKENQKFGNEKNGGARSQVKEEPKNSSEEKFKGWKNRTEKGKKIENKGWEQCHAFLPENTKKMHKTRSFGPN